MNAKELILAKINATPELVDIYTYLTTIGTPFMDIADIMTSPAFGFILKAVEPNIFDEGTSGYKAKTGIDWFLDKKILPGVNTDLLRQLLPGIPEYFDIPGLLTLENVQKALDTLYDYLEHPVTINDPDAIDNIREQLDEQGKSINRLFGYEYIPKSDVRNVIKYLELERDKQAYKASLSEEEIDKIRSISDIIPAIEEMTIVGGAQGINQGQKTNLFDNRSFIKRLENFINKTVDAKTPEDIKKKPGYQPSNFNFREFVVDENYRDACIRDYDTIKYTYNILEALTTLPHFWEMLKTTYASKNAITLSSWKSNALWTMADVIEKESNSYITQDDWKAGTSYLNDYVIASFLANSGIEIEIPVGAKYYSGLGIKGILENKVQGYKIKLNSISNIATFKKIMDEHIIPSLFRNLDFAGNKFIDNLMPMASVSGDKILTGWKLPLNMMLIDASPNTKLLWSDILNGFDQIANQTVPGINMKLGDLFYLYNLIVNKDSFGQSSFTRLFENQVNTNDDTSLPTKFNAFISKLDKGEIVLPITPIMLDEMKYRIKKANPNSNIKSPISKWLELPSDYTLDLPKFFQLPTTRERNYETIQETSSYNIGTSNTDGLYALVQNLGQMYGGENQPTVNLITDEDLANLPASARNAKAFILDGNVYFNINSAHMSDGLHELSHLVLAAMKFSENPEIRQQYYTLVGKMKDRSIVSEERFNNIVDKYKNGEEDILITSDILEEVLANEFAFWLEGEVFENNPFLTIDSEKNVLKAIQNMLNIDKDLQLKDIEGKTLNEILQAFGKELLNTTAIDSQFILRSQRVGAKKVQLYKDEKLKCK